MKKLLSLILALLLCFSLIACEKQDADDTAVTTADPTVLSQKTFSASSEYVKALGRTYFSEDNTLWLSYSATGLEFTFTGTDLSFDMAGPDGLEYMSFKNHPRFAVYVNGERVLDTVLHESEKTYKILENAPEAEYTISLVKLSAATVSNLAVKAINVTSKGSLVPTPKKDLTIEFIGDSITCAYGVDDEDKTHGYSSSTEDATKSYAYLTAQLLGADYSLVCRSGHGVISGYSGDGTRNTRCLMQDYYEDFGSSWGGALNGVNPDDIDWDFESNPVDVVVINFGTNDVSYTKTNPKTLEPEFEALYVEFLKQIRRNNPNATIVCTLGTMDNRLFRNIESAASAYTTETGDTNIHTFQIGARKSDEPLAADYHPSLASHTRAANELTEFLKTILQ